MHYIKYKEMKHHGTADFPAGYYHVTESHPQYAMPYHWHEELELIHIVSGTFHVTINETTRTAAAGDILLVNSGGLHGGTPYDLSLIHIWISHSDHLGCLYSGLPDLDSGCQPFHIQ